MKKVKFRAWDEQSKQMHHDFEWISSDSDGNDWIVFRSDRQRLSSKPHPFKNPWFRQQFHIMQYTGLKDKLGREIYDGDILDTFPDTGASEAGRSPMIQVVFDPPSFTLKKMNGNFTFFLWHRDCDVQPYKIIGNIHQHPELLEAK